MIYEVKYTILCITLWVYTSTASPSKYFLKLNEDQEKDVKSLLSSNNYIVKESSIPKTKEISHDSDFSDDESTVLLSKLSDKELVTLLSKQPQLDRSDEVNIKQAIKSLEDKPSIKKKKDSAVPAESSVSDQGSGFFRLDNKEVDTSSFTGADPKYLAHQRIKNLLSGSQTQNIEDIDDDEQGKELLFDILVAQLKKLCCKSSKHKKKSAKPATYEPLLNDLFEKSRDTKLSADLHEQMFLVINDEIETEQDSDLIYVDPDSLSKNSSVLLLGPITTPLSDSELNTAMNRITKELSRPEYGPLLQDLSEGKVNKSNKRLVKSLVSGSNTRRFIKPHRCRYRYPLAQGPKWLVCTGYLNINTPSLYD